jgi:hypothetical protein
MTTKGRKRLFQHSADLLKSRKIPVLKIGHNGIFHRRLPKGSPPFEKGRTGGISGKSFSEGLNLTNLAV